MLGIHAINHYNKKNNFSIWFLQGKPFDMKDHEYSLPSQPLGKRTNKQNQTTQKNTQLEKTQ